MKREGRRKNMQVKRLCGKKEPSKEERILLFVPTVESRIGKREKLI